MDSRINNGMCRCCASEGTFKDLASTYHWMGEEEIYAEMLKECLDIHLSSSEDGEEGGICEVCITQLRNASNFKKQVLHTERQFKKRLQERLFKTSIVKVEVPGPDEDALESDNDNNVSEDFSGTEYEVPIKEEIEEPKPKKRAARATTSRVKKLKSEHGETSTKQQEKISLDKKVNFSSIISIAPWSEQSESKTKKKRSKILEPDFIDPDLSGKDSPNLEDLTFDDLGKEEEIEEEIEKPIKVKRSPRKSIDVKESLLGKPRLAEIDLHIDNVKTIISCSNVTPVRGRNGDKYACSYCRKEFSDPRDLKYHSIEKHLKKNKDIKPSCFKIKQLSKFIALLDITSLMCKLCFKKMYTLQELTEHLKDVHEEIIHPNIKTQVVPFKFEQDRMKCGICDKESENFDQLEAHVATHTKNNVCQFCEMAFIVKHKMVEHKKLVHKV